MRLARNAALGSAYAVLLYACSSTTSDPSDPARSGDMPASEGGVALNDGGRAQPNPSLKDASGTPPKDATTDGHEQVTAPGEPSVRLVGRFDTTDPEGARASWPGAQIIARFTGTEVRGAFKDVRSFRDGLSQWEIVIDGERKGVFAVERTALTYTLASGLSPGTHTIELFRLTEPNVGATQFRGFEFPDGSLLSPPPERVRHIEFLGDSASNGYGIDGAGPACPFTAETQNAKKAYPALVAADLSADHHNLSASGKGLYWNYTRTDPDVYSRVYLRALPLTATSLWDFAGYTPDVVWMTLGGNDWDMPTAGDPPPPVDQFQLKYDEMVSLIREKHPNAHIVCAIAPSLNNDYPPGYNAYTNIKTVVAAVVNARAAAGETKLHFFEFTRSVGADLTGCSSHPNPVKHRAMATEATAFIRSVTGW